jgi:acyl-CoA hydrolase
MLAAMTDVAARPPRLSFTEMTEIVLPQHANALGTAFGGIVLSWIDICGAVAAQRHCGRVAVTAAIDDMQFLAPIRVGEVVRLTGRVNAAFRTSVEVEVQVEREDIATMERTLCADALLTFVNRDESGRPVPAPALLPETDEERARVAEATERRAQRLAKKRR